MRRGTDARMEASEGRAQSSVLATSLQDGSAAGGVKHVRDGEQNNQTHRHQQMYTNAHTRAEHHGIVRRTEHIACVFSRKDEQSSKIFPMFNFQQAGHLMSE